MGARLRIFLTQEQDKTLLKLRTANVPQKVKEKIAAHFNWTPQTVREVLHKWQKLGMEGFWELSGRGGKPKWKEADIEFLTECLKNEPRTYNSVQLAKKLEKERSIKLSPDRLRRILKKKGLFGNERERATKENKKSEHAQSNKPT
ncbi:helix-turn-helix domain-containing protein [Microcoleus sp. LAD1_D5]|uniref:helix-turn-helix domain-containing protein n=1 Tax=unclassified Microcoleus TaxID=2642155 RepID=UPI002FD6F09F